MFLFGMAEYSIIGINDLVGW